MAELLTTTNHSAAEYFQQAPFIIIQTHLDDIILLQVFLPPFSTALPGLKKFRNCHSRVRAGNSTVIFLLHN